MKVKKNQYGYYEKIDMSDAIEFNEMYAEKFYQGNAGTTSYNHEYTEQELRNFVRNAAKKELVIGKLLNTSEKKSFLDIGCGEGYVLDYFYKKGWDITGMDLSEYGLLAHNPHIRNFLLQGDCNKWLEDMIKQGIKYDVINCDLYLECNTNPLKTLNNIKSVIKSNSGIAIIRVGNCLSPLHKQLLKQGILHEETWFDRIGNFSYFGKESLKNLLESSGYECIEWYGDTFVDFNLINPIANYYDVKGIGEICYKAMLDIEDIMESVSLEKMVEVEKIMGDMGFGRHITCVCKVKKELCD
ncbi:MAG: class I SAM-dependent methyltransferase [Lachnospiraceae bacterium]|nr:class I SAM-dependent methyltransferase [Lachnospiraceae bacterium]